jgi:diguanylate cyclase (GGDEF)-like protein
VTDIDGLTHCGTKGALRFKLSSALMNIARRPERFQQSFICVDIDNFVRFADMNGHTAGDPILKTIAQRLSCSYPQSTIYRYGGDEFVVAGAGQWNAEISAGLEVKLKHTIVDVDLSVEDGRHHRATGWLMLHIEAGIIQSSVRGEHLKCRDRKKHRPFLDGSLFVSADRVEAIESEIPTVLSNRYGLSKRFRCWLADVLRPTMNCS